MIGFLGFCRRRMAFPIHRTLPLPSKHNQEEEKEIVEGLRNVGIGLQNPPPSTEQLIDLLDVRTLFIYILKFVSLFDVVVKLVF